MRTITDRMDAGDLRIETQRNDLKEHITWVRLNEGTETLTLNVEDLKAILAWVEELNKEGRR